MKRPRTISIGGVTYDLFVQIPHESVHMEGSPCFEIPLGSKLRVERVTETCGGGAGNTSVGLARLGCSASISSVIGADQWGQRLLENFRNEGVKTESLTVVEKETTSFSIILNARSGERVILYAPGTNAHLHDAVFDREAVADADWVILNHIQEQGCIIQDDIIAMLSASKKGFTWNPGGYILDRGVKEKENQLLLACTTLLILNREELERFTGIADMHEAMQCIVQCGTRYVCVTDGAKGSIATDGHTLYRCPVCPDVDVVDTTGAGDAFTTATTWALLCGQDLPNAMKAGTINSGSVVGVIGAQDGLLEDLELRDRLQSTNIDVSAEPL
jgi:sugar/nucleoside kinase (ribokinase family)